MNRGYETCSITKLMLAKVRFNGTMIGFFPGLLIATILSPGWTWPTLLVWPWLLLAVVGAIVGYYVSPPIARKMNKLPTKVVHHQQTVEI